MKVWLLVGKTLSAQGRGEDKRRHLKHEGELWIMDDLRLTLVVSLLKHCRLEVWSSLRLKSGGLASSRGAATLEANRPGLESARRGE
jgi:hypothetical protein